MLEPTFHGFIWVMVTQGCSFCKIHWVKICDIQYKVYFKKSSQGWRVGLGVMKIQGGRYTREQMSEDSWDEGFCFGGGESSSAPARLPTGWETQRIQGWLRATCPGHAGGGSCLARVERGKAVGGPGFEWKDRQLPLRSIKLLNHYDAHLKLI